MFSTPRIVWKWKTIFANLLSFAVLAFLPSSLYAGSSLSVSRPNLRPDAIIADHLRLEDTSMKSEIKLTLKSKGVWLRRWKVYRLRGGNEGELQNVANESEKSGSTPTQPRGWGLTAEQSALYNTSLEEANSVEYEVMAFLQV